MAIPNEPLSRLEQYLNRIATENGTIPEEPLTRAEMYLNKIATGSGNVPETSHTRLEMYLNKIATGSGNVPEAPYTRAEMYLNKIATGDGNTPEEALTRIEQYLAEIANSGGSTNGLVDGDYTVSGATIKVENNRISGINTINYRRYTIPFKTAISLHAGDVVKFIAKNVVQEETNNSALVIGINGSAINDGGYFCPFRSSPLSKTVTLAEDINAESFFIKTLESMNSRSFELSITVNGEEAFA